MSRDHHDRTPVAVHLAATTQDKVAWNSDRTAEELSISPRHLADLVSEGLIPSFKLGRSRRFDPDAVRAAVKKIQAGG